MLETQPIAYLFSTAFRWLCKQRKSHPASSDIWDFKRDWPDQTDSIINSFIRGNYKLGLLKKVRLSTGEKIAVWSSRDAMVIKVLSLLIEKKIKPILPKTVYNLKGNGGRKQLMADIRDCCHCNTFFYRTDIKSYYNSIEHCKLLLRLHDIIDEPMILEYVWQYLNRCVEWGGIYEDIHIGVPRGSSLSPLLGSFFLLELDLKMQNIGVTYFRYMDDILILSPKRWKLKKAIRLLNETLNALGLEKHPDKNMIGRIEKGFDFVGFYFKPESVSISSVSLEKFLNRINRLYEQDASPDRIGRYELKWSRSFFGLC